MDEQAIEEKIEKCISSLLSDSGFAMPKKFKCVCCAQEFRERCRLLSANFAFKKIFQQRYKR